jgi:hypothetical protein
MFDVSVHSLAFGWPGSFRAGSSFGRRSYAHSLALSSKCKHGISRAHLRLLGYKVFSWLSLSFFPSSMCLLSCTKRKRKISYVGSFLSVFSKSLWLAP